ncbi:MAG TPA: right-handed parallel beta-helix repeat-containing protein [Kofleriaceae bacterium]|nr:right-handed parallel beta-helix repeat-containing protein [Kofleriaceae bacterium]
MRLHPACVCAAVLAIAGASHAAPNEPPVRPPARPPGVRGDGVTDDRAALQAAIDRAAASSGELVLPAGTYLIAAADHQAFGLKIPRGVRLRGADRERTVLQQAPGTLPSVRLLMLTGEGIQIENLTLDGNKRKQTVNEHRHGIFAQNTDHLVVKHVTSRNFTGDGFYLYDGANRSTFDDVLATGNDRNGLTLGGSIDGTLITHSKFVANKGQQLDSEPGGEHVVSNTKVVDNDLDGAGVSGEYVLTCSGTAARTPGHGWTVTGNRIHGGVFVVWAEHVTISDNTFVNPTTKSAVNVYRSSSDVTITGNKITQTAPGTAGITVLGTAASGPQRVLVSKNHIETTRENSYGVQASGAQSVVIADNVLRGAGRPAVGYAGILLRATNPTVDFESAVVRGNRISNFGARAINIMGNRQARLQSVEITGNTFEDDSPVPSMTEGISLDDGTGAARQISVIGNKFVGGVRTEMTNYPANVPVLVGGVRGRGGRYEIAGSPEGNLAETDGAVVIRRDRGAGARYFVKRSGAGAKTGWVPSTTAPDGRPEQSDRGGAEQGDRGGAERSEPPRPPPARPEPAPPREGRSGRDRAPDPPRGR